MNAIDVWKAAKNGDVVYQPGNVYKKFIVSKDRHGLSQFINNIIEQVGPNDDEWLTLDTWKIQKTRKEEMTMGELRQRNGVHVVEPAGLVSTHIPNCAKVTIEWLE